MKSNKAQIERIAKSSGTIEVEIYEGKNCPYYEVGQKFKYPEEMSKLCPWLLDSINSMIRVLQFGGELPWTYEGTPYEKVIDQDGITTEFVRCPDPTAAGLIVKITKTKNKEI